MYVAWDFGEYSNRICSDSGLVHSDVEEYARGSIQGDRENFVGQRRLCRYQDCCAVSSLFVGSLALRRPFYKCVVDGKLKVSISFFRSYSYAPFLFLPSVFFFFGSLVMCSFVPKIRLARHSLPPIILRCTFFSLFRMYELLWPQNLCLGLGKLVKLHPRCVRCI